MKNKGGGDEEPILYCENICVGYHCEKNNAAGITLLKEISCNVVIKFKWTQRYKEILILGYDEFKNARVNLQVNK